MTIHELYSGPLGYVATRLFRTERLRRAYMLDLTGPCPRVVSRAALAAELRRGGFVALAHEAIGRRVFDDEVLALISVEVIGGPSFVRLAAIPLSQRHAA